MADTKVRIGGAWKTLAAVSVRIGGAWKSVSVISVRIGGAWKEVWSAFTLSGGAKGDSSDTDAGTVTVGWRFDTDGSMDKMVGGTWSTNVASWGTPNKTGVGSEYEVQASYSGDAVLKSSLADGTTWYNLGSLTTFNKSTSGIFASGTYTFTVREVADTSNSVVITATVTTEDGS